MTKKEQEARSEAARLLSRGRWEGTTHEERVEFMTKIQALRTAPSGAAVRSDKPRCPCGEMTAARAKARGHWCEAPKPAKGKK